MFKWLRKKILEKIVSDFIEDLPKYKGMALSIFMEKKDEIIKRVEKAVLEAIKRFFEKEFNKRLGNSNK